MTPESTDWLTKGACRKHPLLHMDAWFKVEGGIPVYEGTVALSVCRFECPVTKECRSWNKSLRSVDSIWGGGWSDALGSHRDHLDDGSTMDTRAAAAYLGVTMNTIHLWVKQAVLTPLRKREGKYFFSPEEVRRVYEDDRVPHGNLAQYRAHLMRGDTPCDQCHKAFVDNPMGLEKHR